MKIAAAAKWIPAIALALMAQHALPVEQQTEPESATRADALPLNQSIEREIGPGQTHIFTVEASSSQFLHVVVKKHGVNVVVTIVSPDGRPLMTADDPRYRAFGTEPASALAEMGGEYQIQVSKSKRTSETGSYRIELTELQSPTEQDRNRLEAETQFYAAVLNERSQGKENRLQAISQYQHAAELWDALHDDDEEALCLHRIAITNKSLGESQKELETLNRALPLWRAAGDRAGEAITLTMIGAVFRDTGNTLSALDYYNQALPLERAAGDRESEVLTLQLMGIFYADTGNNPKALDYYKQALVLSRSLEDRQNESNLLSSMGLSYQELGENQKALENFSQALPLSRALHDRYGEAAVLTNIGLTCRELGDDQRALDYFNQALPLFRAIGDRDSEGPVLYDIGQSYLELGENQKALNYGERALLLARNNGDRRTEALALSLISQTYSNLKQWRKAFDYDIRALHLSRATGNRLMEVWTLDGIGEANMRLGNKQKALQDYIEALQIACADANPSQEGAVSEDLMLYWQSEKNPGLAIFFGKQAVNFLQQMRGKMQGVDTGLENTFLISNESYYHGLANLLIDQGRLSEAQQALDLLKQQEYTDYTRGDATEAMGKLSLTPAEHQAEEDYQKITAQLVSLGQQWSDLKKMKSRSPEQEQQYQQLSSQLDVASKGLNTYFARLYVLLGEDGEANRQLAEVKGDLSLLKQQVSTMPNTVALYTMVAGDRYRVIVITSSAMVAREYPITDKNLNLKVAAFQEVLRDPTNDPRPLAHELYNILIGPVKADLDQAHAETLVWSLDGVLRYIPLAALYDGKRYLIENYSLVTLTPASMPYLSAKPELENVSAVGMGISRKYEDDLNPLPTVVTELDSIVKDPQVPGANGVLQGSILLNDQFTEKAMEDQLDGQHAIVHIASHFVLRPGDDSQSYLLLAGKDNDSAGYHLTVADFRDNQNLSLSDTDLLTLSACETGVSSNASNGREVDGLATTAQLKGAKAVISSLWQVNDASTGELMADFYKRWVDGRGKVMKVEALRQAQLDLLTGKIAPQPNQPDPNAPTNFAHPYYWAPFILMGNWM